MTLQFIQNDSFSSPLFKTLIDDKEFIFLFDTGAWFNSFSVEGLNKWECGLELYREGKEKYAKQLEQDECVLEFTVDFIKISNNTFKDIPFRYCERHSDCDGIIGYNFFQEFTNFTIDFRKKEIRTDEKPILGEEFPLIIGEKSINNTLENLLHTIVKIDNKEVYALIDTGFSSNEKMIFIDSSLNSKLIGKDDYPIYQVDLKIGNIINEKIPGRKLIYGGGKLGSGEIIRELIKNINIIGCSIFSDHILQIDLKNKIFRIA